MISCNFLQVTVDHQAKKRTQTTLTLTTTLIKEKPTTKTLRLSRKQLPNRKISLLHTHIFVKKELEQENFFEWLEENKKNTVLIVRNHSYHRDERTG